MKITWKKTLTGVAAPALAILFVTAASWSMAEGDAPRHDPQHKVDHLVKMLQLTDEQEATVLTLLTASFEESEVDHERLHTLREELLNQPESFDKATALTTADEIGQITTRMVYRMASTRAAIYQLLDDEQKVAMAQMSEKRGYKRRGHKPDDF